MTILRKFTPADILMSPYFKQRKHIF